MLAQVAGRDMRLAIRVRSLAIRIHYEDLEWEEWEFYEHQLQTLRRYLLSRKKDLIAPIQERYQVFLDFAQKLGQLKIQKKPSKEKIKSIINAINNAKQLAMLRPWLLEKAEELNAPPP